MVVLTIQARQARESARRHPENATPLCVISQIACHNQHGTKHRRMNESLGDGRVESVGESEMSALPQHSQAAIAVKEPVNQRRNELRRLQRRTNFANRSSLAMPLPEPKRTMRWRQSIQDLFGCDAARSGRRNVMWSSESMTLCGIPSCGTRSSSWNRNVFLVVIRCSLTRLKNCSN
jgi:hypothetical protein